MNADVNVERPNQAEIGLTQGEGEKAMDWRWFLVWLLICGGLFTILLAGPISQALVPKTYHSPTSFGWSPEQAKEIADNVRLFGILAIAAGLVERLAIAITSLRQDAS